MYTDKEIFTGQYYKDPLWTMTTELAKDILVGSGLVKRVLTAAFTAQPPRTAEGLWSIATGVGIYGSARYGPKADSQLGVGVICPTSGPILPLTTISQARDGPGGTQPASESTES